MNGPPRGVGLVFCIGAQKGGASWLYEIPLDSPNCHFGATKEMYYFDVHAGTEMSHLHERIALARRRVDVDLSRICAAPSARLSHFPFEGDRALPAQC